MGKSRKSLAALCGCAMLLTSAGLASGQEKRVTTQSRGERVLTQGPAGE